MNTQPNPFATQPAPVSETVPAAAAPIPPAQPVQTAQPAPAQVSQEPAPLPAPAQPVPAAPPPTFAQPIQPPPQPVAEPDDFLEFTISGCYYDSRKEKIDFENVVGKIPMCDEEQGIGSMHVRGRYAERWVKAELDADGEPKYPKRIEKMCQVHIDDVKVVKGTLSFVGKNIKDLSIDEMQDLATAKDLRFIPLPNSGLSKRDMLIRAYVAYADKILEKKVDYQDEKFNFASLPDIILDGQLRTEVSGKISNEEIISKEQQATVTNYGDRDNPRDRFTLDELKKLADSKNISYPENVEFNDLYSHLFSA